MSEIGQKLIESVRKVAADNPDFVYDAPCQYVVGGKPGCIVGKAAWDIGLIDASFEDNIDANSGGIDDLHRELRRLARIEGFDVDEQMWLAEAQDAQDTGEPWGAVPEVADRYVANRYDSNSG